MYIILVCSMVLVHTDSNSGRCCSVGMLISSTFEIHLLGTHTQYLMLLLSPLMHVQVLSHAIKIALGGFFFGKKKEITHA